MKGGTVPGDDLSKGPPYQRGQVDPGLYVGPLRLRPEPGKDPGRVPDPLLRVRPPHRRQRVSFEQGPVQNHHGPGAEAGRRRAVLSDPPIVPPWGAGPGGGAEHRL